MANQLTVTAKTGPAQQATALVIASVKGVNYDFERSVVQVRAAEPNSIKEFDLAGVTTLTITLSAGNYTLVLS